jgi:hypothetical protein
MNYLKPYGNIRKRKKKGEDGRGEILPSFKPCPFGKGITFV